jgi:hypothetical protein
MLWIWSCRYVMAWCPHNNFVPRASPLIVPWVWRLSLALPCDSYVELDMINKRASSLLRSQGHIESLASKSAYDKSMMFTLSSGYLLCSMCHNCRNIDLSRSRKYSLLQKLVVDVYLSTRPINEPKRIATQYAMLRPSLLQTTSIWV